MLSFRLFTLLLAFSLLSGAESDDQGVPCEDGETTPPEDKEILSSTEKATELTVLSSTTTPQLCRNSLFTAFKRKNGWWCARIYGLPVPGSQPYSIAFDDCILNRMVLSSIETEEEWAHWKQAAPVFPGNNITAIWMGASYNDSAQQWYWSDGNALQTMEPQPKVVTPGGQVAWFLYEGDKVLKVTNASVDSTVWVNGYVCGYPSPVSI